MDSYFALFYLVTPSSCDSPVILLTCLLTYLLTYLLTWWRGGATGGALDLRSTGRGFKSYSGQKLRNNLGQVVHTCVLLSPSSITCYRPTGNDVLRAGKVTAGLAESNGSLPPGG